MTCGISRTFPIMTNYTERASIGQSGRACYASCYTPELHSPHGDTDLPLATHTIYCTGNMTLYIFGRAPSPGLDKGQSIKSSCFESTQVEST